MGVFDWFKKMFRGKAGSFAEGHVFNEMGGGLGGEVASRAAGAATAKGVDVGADAAKNKAAGNKAGGNQRAGENVDIGDGVMARVYTADNSDVLAQSGDASYIKLDEGEFVWVQGFTLKSPTHCDEWQDNWGPLASHNQDLNEFAFHMSSIENENQAGEPQDHIPNICQRLGYADVGQWFHVRLTFLKYYGEGDRSDLGCMHFGSNAFSAAIMQAASRVQQAKMEATAAANPEILEPIEGITVEIYAQCAAQAAQGLDQAAFQQLLGQYGMDQPMFDRVQAGWTARMATDTTATIASIYGKAFQQQGAGQFGAAGAAAGDASSGMGAYGQGGAGGEEPVSFEKLCEIQGAQSAWSDTGQDVNAMLKQVFNMNALDWSNMSSWWMSKMMADPAMFEKYNQWIEHYKAQYLQQAGHNANPDADISF